MCSWCKLSAVLLQVIENVDCGVEVYGGGGGKRIAVGTRDNMCDI